MEEKVNKTGKVLALCSQKGGVGKTTSCVNLAVGLVKAGKKVLVIDNDPQGSMTASLGYQNPDELPVTLATILARIVEDEPFEDTFGILHHEEGIDLLPANIELSGMEVSLVNIMSRERVPGSFLQTRRHAPGWLPVCPKPCHLQPALPKGSDGGYTGWYKHSANIYKKNSQILLPVPETLKNDPVLMLPLPAALFHSHS